MPTTIILVVFWPPNGDIHFIPNWARWGQKISASGVVSTYTLAYTASSAYFGGVLAPNGDIHMIPYNSKIGQVINKNSGMNFDMGTCLHSHFNKL